VNDSGKAVFLSYASQDAEAAKRICDALRAAGVEVWFDAEGGLEHGDEWDAKIRRQIKECVLFLPIISANTQAREEGYFRIEWELAAQRALGIASGVAFILPIVIDDTREPGALVPDRFRTVQWTRLRGGELTTEVKARFLKLWSHRAGMVSHESARPAPSSGERPELVAKPGAKVYLGLAAAVFALVALVGWWFLRHDAPVVPPVAPSPAVVAAPTPASGAGPQLSEARQLAERARTLFDALDSSRDDYKFAEELIAQAKAAGANDADVWAAAAQLEERYNVRGWDMSDGRREAARMAAQRALRLDPRSFEARFAQAGLLSYTGREGMEKEKLLRDLLRERPADHRVLRDLGSTLERLGQTDEGIAFMDQAAALPGGDPLALYNKSLGYWFAGRTVEAEAAIQATIAQKPFTGALLVSAWYAMVLHGDLDGAKSTMERISPADLQEDRGCFFAYFLAFLRREPDAALARLQAMPRDWINDNWCRGPKGRLAGDALQLAGRPEAAAAARRAALRLVEDRLATNPTSGPLLYNRVLLLAALGERAEAEKQFAVVLQMQGLDSSGEKPAPSWVTHVNIWLGRKKEAIQLISLGLKQQRRAVDYTAALLRLDPTFDPLRTEPEFAQLVSQAEAIELAALPARDWPKDPELKKAIGLAEGLEAIPDDLTLAEDLAKRALDRSPTDIEAVTVMARIQSHFLRRGFDRSDERAALAKRYAERALQLAPDEPEAMYALATYHFSRATGEAARTEQLLRRAIELDPTNPRPGRLLADLFNATKRPADAIAQGQDNVRRFPRDVLSHYDLARTYKDQNRYDEFDRELDATLALAPLPNAIVWKARLQFGLRNDFAGMKAWLDRVPARVRGTERAVFGYFLYAAFGGAPEAGLEALRDFPQKWFTDFEYAGPTALLNASLLELQGKKELALRQYEMAQGEIQRMRQTDPARIGLSQVEFWTLLGLGHTEEAKVSHRRMVEGSRRPYGQDTVNGWWFTVIPGSLLIGDRATALTLLRESVETLPESRAAFRLRFRIDPRMAPFRDDPEIKTLLAEPEAKK
jgi:tetratricopeptide (TPR) repeat protein